MPSINPYYTPEEEAAARLRQKRRLTVHYAIRRRRLAEAQRRTRFHRILILNLIAGLVVTGTGAFAAVQLLATAQVGLPTAAAILADNPPADSYVYADNGTLLADLHQPNVRHDPVALNAISPLLQEATIATEDKGFYSEGAVDVQRVAAAAYNDINGGSTQGASTITEQLAKLSLPPAPRTLAEKVNELLLGNQITSEFSKQAVLDMYLNRIFYGNYSLGIGTAALLYFHKTALTLDLAQSSLLAGLPQSPTYLDPVLKNAVTLVAPGSPAKLRQAHVLQSMVANLDITQAEANQALAEPLTVFPWQDSEINNDPDFEDYLLTYLNQTIGSAYLDPGGLAIDTTLNPADQANAYNDVHGGISLIRKRNAKDGALVSIDPSTGDVLAMVGTWNYADPGDGQLNMATQRRQTGSAIKIFTYSAALATGLFTMTTPVLDAPITFTPPGGPAYSPFDYDLRWHGWCEVKKCIGNSLNVPAIKVEVAVGIKYIDSVEIASGLNSLLYCDTSTKPPTCNLPGPYSYAATLGSLTLGVTPLEFADAGATIADMGVHHPSTPITKIVDIATNKVVVNYNPAAYAVQVLPPGVAFIMSEMLSNNQNRLPEFSRDNAEVVSGRMVAAKTGTTQFFTDNWTIGWTPQVITAVWVGNPSPSCLKPADYGFMANAIAKGDTIYPHQSVSDPYSPQDLAHYGLQPLNNNCGHVDGETGVSGAAPIWNRFMSFALKNLPHVWYTKPAYVTEIGSGNTGNFYLPGTGPDTTYNTPLPNAHP